MTKLSLVCWELTKTKETKTTKYKQRNQSSPYNSFSVQTNSEKIYPKDWVKVFEHKATDISSLFLFEQPVAACHAHFLPICYVITLIFIYIDGRYAFICKFIKVSQMWYIKYLQPYQKQSIQNQKLPGVSKPKYSLRNINFYVRKVTMGS